MKVLVGIAEMAVSRRQGSVLVAPGIASGIGVSAYDPEARLAGIAHCMLPMSRLDPEKARTLPCVFTDTGVAALLQQMLDNGASLSRLVVKVAGAASPLGAEDVVRIGERNLVVLRKLLNANGIEVGGETVGGTESRTLSLAVDSGIVTVKRGNGERLL